MIDLICLGLINALFIWGIFCLFDDGYILEGPGKVIEATIGSYLAQPLFRCQSCMASVWGVIFYVIAQGISWVILPYCICLCGFNYILVKIVYK